MIIPPWAYGAAVVLTLSVGFGAGWKVQGWRCDAAKNAAIERALKRYDEKLAKQNEEARDYESEREQARRSGVDREQAIRTVYRTVEVPGECAAPPDVRGVLDDAVREANARAAGESLPTVPAAP